MNPSEEILRDLARQVEANVPDHRAPEAFHVRKSEIAAKLRQIAEAHVDG